MNLHGFPHRILSPARLPVPPRPQPLRDQYNIFPALWQARPFGPSPVFRRSQKTILKGKKAGLWLQRGHSRPHSDNKTRHPSASASAMKCGHTEKTFRHRCHATAKHDKLERFTEPHQRGEIFQPLVIGHARQAVTSTSVNISNGSSPKPLPATPVNVSSPPDRHTSLARSWCPRKRRAFLPERTDASRTASNNLGRTARLMYV